MGCGASAVSVASETEPPFDGEYYTVSTALRDATKILAVHNKRGQEPIPVQLVGRVSPVPNTALLQSPFTEMDPERCDNERAKVAGRSEDDPLAKDVERKKVFEKPNPNPNPNPSVPNLRES